MKTRIKAGGLGASDTAWWPVGNAGMKEAFEFETRRLFTSVPEMLPSHLLSCF